MKKQRIVIIGASSGLGKEITSQFAQMGWTIGIAARRIDALKELQQQFPESIVATEQIDVTSVDAGEKLLSLIKNVGGIDTLLLASGIGSQNPSLGIDIELNTVKTNTLGFTHIVDTAFNYFRNRSNDETPGQIAVISSIAGTMGLGIAPSYSATKRYQRHYIDALEQLAHFEKVNVKFTDIRPGFVDTPLLNNCRKFPMLMSVEYATPRIVKAILRRKRVSIIDWRWRIVVAFWHLFPRCIWRRFPAK
jgi:short-subunit dehydrogenase